LTESSVAYGGGLSAWQDDDIAIGSRGRTPVPETFPDHPLDSVASGCGSIDLAGHRQPEPGLPEFIAPGQYLEAFIAEDRGPLENPAELGRFGQSVLALKTGRLAPFWGGVLETRVGHVITLSA
jgi:hypothetical protein